MYYFFSFFIKCESFCEVQFVPCLCLLTIWRRICPCLSYVSRFIFDRLQSAKSRQATVTWLAPVSLGNYGKLNIHTSPWSLYVYYFWCCVNWPQGKLSYIKFQKQGRLFSWKCLCPCCCWMTEPCAQTWACVQRDRRVFCFCTRFCYTDRYKTTAPLLPFIATPRRNTAHLLLCSVDERDRIIRKMDPCDCAKSK